MQVEPKGSIRKRHKAFAVFVLDGLVRAFFVDADAPMAPGYLLYVLFGQLHGLCHTCPGDDQQGQPPAFP